jgi:hypothetical protein
MRDYQVAKKENQTKETGITRILVEKSNSPWKIVENQVFALFCTHIVIMPKSIFQWIDH